MLTVKDVIKYAENPLAFIEKSEKEYREKVEAVADAICADSRNKIILVAGPSASGKTTTSALLQKDLLKRGKTAEVISLDNFFAEKSKMPLKADGQPDFEAVESLDLEMLHTFFIDILADGVAEMPIFDFNNPKKERDKKLLDAGENGLLIVEGLHALNPKITSNLPPENLYKIYISVNDSIYNDEGSEFMSSIHVRMARRISRDYFYRSSDINNTLYLWTAVVEGEKKYLYGFKHSADVTLATLHPYEPCVLKKSVLKIMEPISKDAPNYLEAIKLKEEISAFPDIPTDIVPENSLLREFL